MHSFFKVIKYLIYILIYLAVTLVVAYIVLAQGIPDDRQCHAMERPLFIHYILAFIITALPVLAVIYSKNKKLKMKEDK